MKNSVYLQKTAYGKKLAKAELFIICDIDGTLVEGNRYDGLGELKQWMEEHSNTIVFGVASGRNKRNYTTSI